MPKEFKYTIILVEGILKEIVEMCTQNYLKMATEIVNSIMRQIDQLEFL